MKRLLADGERRKRRRVPGLANELAEKALERRQVDAAAADATSAAATSTGATAAAVDHVRLDFDLLARCFPHLALTVRVCVLCA